MRGRDGGDLSKGLRVARCSAGEDDQRNLPSVEISLLAHFPDSYFYWSLLSVGAKAGGANKSRGFEKWLEVFFLQENIVEAIAGRANTPEGCLKTVGVVQLLESLLAEAMAMVKSRRVWTLLKILLGTVLTQGMLLLMGLFL